MKTIFYSFYNLLLYIALPFIWVSAYFNEKLAGSLSGQRDITARVLRFNDKVKSNPKPIIWTHAASAGEFEQMRPVLARLSQLDVYIYQTFTSATIFYKASHNEINSSLQANLKMFFTNNSNVIAYLFFNLLYIQLPTSS